MNKHLLAIGTLALCMYHTINECTPLGQPSIPAAISQEQFEIKLNTITSDDIKSSIGTLEMLVGSLVRQIETMRAQHGERGATECCKLLDTLFRSSFESITNASRTLEQAKGKELLTERLRSMQPSELAQFKESLLNLTTSLESVNFDFKYHTQRYINALLACIYKAMQE